MHEHQVKGGLTLVTPMIQPSGDVVMNVVTPILEIFSSNELGNERTIVDPHTNVTTLVLEFSDMNTNSAANL